MLKSLLTLAVAAAAVSAAPQASAEILTKNLPVQRTAQFDRNLSSQRSLIRKKGVSRPTSPRAIRSDETTSLAWGYCMDPATSLNIDGDIKIAIMMTADINTKFSGNFITGVDVANPVDADNAIPEEFFYPNVVKEATVWLSESLDGEHIREATGSLGDLGFEWSRINFDEPYELKGDQKLYIGVSMSVPEGIYGFVADYYYPDNSYSAYLYSKAIGLDDNWDVIFGDEPAWVEAGEWCGNACLRAVIEGDKLPQNIVDIEDYVVPTAMATGSEFPVNLLIANYGANDINTIDVTMEIEGMEPQTRTCEIMTDYDIDWNPIYGPLAYNRYGNVDAYFISEANGNNIPYKLYISKLNGEAVNNGNAEVEGVLLSLEGGYPKNNVVEEATGTWCGNCVLGYAGMEYIRENIPSLIGIAVHGYDEMDVLEEGRAYHPFEQYMPGFPEGFINRNWNGSVYPNPDELAYQYELICDIPALAEINAKLENIDESGRKVRLSADYKFCIGEENGSYGIAYTVIEDNVGPYRQTNYYSDGDEYAWGFEDMPEQVSLIFNEVARNCSHPLPLEGSILNTTEAEKTYSFSTEIELTDVNDLTKYRIVPMVINNISGVIENACVVESPTYVGVNGITSESKVTPVAFGGDGFITVMATGRDTSIFTADGRCMASGIKSGKVSMTPGLYIVSNGSRSSKVIVR